MNIDMNALTTSYRTSKVVGAPVVITTGATIESLKALPEYKYVL